MRMGGLAKGFVSIVIAALLLFVLTFVHPGPFFASIRIPDPRTLLEIALGVIFIVAIILLAKSKFSKQIKIAFISALVSITLYFILRFIHIPGKILWGILVLSLMAIIWAAITVFSKKGK
jgi:hypothetical protein